MTRAPENGMPGEAAMLRSFLLFDSTSSRERDFALFLRDHLIRVRALEDDLSVEVTRRGDSFPEVFLTGPAQRVGEIRLSAHRG